MDFVDTMCNSQQTQQVLIVIDDGACLNLYKELRTKVSLLVAFFSDECNDVSQTDGHSLFERHDRNRRKKVTGCPI